MQALKKAENKHSKNQENVFEGPFSKLYVIIEVLPPPSSEVSSPYQPLNTHPHPNLQPLPIHNITLPDLGDARIR